MWLTDFSWYTSNPDLFTREDHSLQSCLLLLSLLCCPSWSLTLLTCEKQGWSGVAEHPALGLPELSEVYWAPALHSEAWG